MSDTPESTTRVVSVEIQGLRYPIRSDLDEQYIVRLAAYVDAKMQRATNEVPTGESMKIAVLAALNIADELFRVARRRAARSQRTAAPHQRDRAHASIARSIACTCRPVALTRARR